MRWTVRGLGAALLCLAVGALVLALAGYAEPSQPDPVPAADIGVVPVAAAAPAATPFPVRGVPGSASTIARASQTLSTQAADLGLDAAPSAAESLGPPSWVKPGTRLTFYEAAASVAQSSFAWVEDPNGDWQDPATGTRYRRTDETGEGVATGSGDGFAQIDVIAVDGTNVALSLNLYGIDHSTNTFVPGPSTGAEVPGGEIDGTWVNPARLAQLAEVRQNGVLVLRGDYPLNGTTYKAISFAVTTPGSYQQYTYDTASGVLLSATTSTAGAASPVTAPGESPPQGNTELTITHFAGVRQRTVPGLDGVNPGWVGQTQGLDYRGTYYWTNPVDPSTGSLTTPMSMDVSLRPGGDSWASYSGQESIQGIGSASTGTGVTGPTGLYWLSPQALSALAKLPAGTVIDKDPITGEQDLMQSVATDSTTGRNLVILQSKLAGITTVEGYDTATGVLAAYVVQIPGSGTTMSLELQGGP